MTWEITKLGVSMTMKKTEHPEDLRKDVSNNIQPEVASEAETHKSKEPDTQKRKVLQTKSQCAENRCGGSKPRCGLCTVKGTSSSPTVAFSDNETEP